MPLVLCSSYVCLSVFVVVCVVAYVFVPIIGTPEWTHNLAKTVKLCSPLGFVKRRNVAL